MQYRGATTETIYDFDAFGNRSKMTVNKNGQNSVTDYSYDGANRLQWETRKEANGDQFRSFYKYDDRGNMVLRSHEAMTSGTASNTISLKDVTAQVDEFKYNDYGELTEAVVGGVKTSYQYRPDGLRISKNVGGVETKHVWDGQNIVLDLDKDYNTVRSYIRGVRLACYNNGGNGVSYLYNFNAHGDVIETVNSADGAVSGYQYDAYGNVLNQNEDKNNPFGYFGQYHDKETGMIYLRARYYEPSTGAFISEDPAKDGLNWYTYGANNPIKFVDPTGERIQLLGNEKDRREFMVLLRQLSYDILTIQEELDGYGNCLYFVKIDTKCLGSSIVGTELIRQLVNHGHVTRLQFGGTTGELSSGGGQVKYSDSNGATRSKFGSDTLITMSRKNIKVLTKGNKDKQSKETEMPAFICLGHELIHALRAMKGETKPSVYGKHWFVDKDGKNKTYENSTWEEELDTVGINYVTEDGTTRHAWNWKITENALRDEHGLPRRVSYP